MNGICTVWRRHFLTSGKQFQRTTCPRDSSTCPIIATPVEISINTKHQSFVILQRTSSTQGYGWLLRAILSELVPGENSTSILPKHVLHSDFSMNIKLFPGRAVVDVCACASNCVAPSKSFTVSIVHRLCIVPGGLNWRQRWRVDATWWETSLHCVGWGHSLS